MRHAGWFAVTCIALLMWALHGLYHVAEAAGVVGYTLTFGALFGPSWTGWAGHVVVELLSGVGLFGFAVWLARERRDDDEEGA